MTYRQDRIPRTCEICKGPIEEDQWMLDLFRESSATPVAWAHEDCCRRAIEKWLVRKRAKETAKRQI